jgi:hypothetical protein
MKTSSSLLFDESTASRIYSVTRHHHLVVLKTPSSPVVRLVEIGGSHPQDLLKDYLEEERKTFEKNKEELRQVKMN